MPPAGSLKVLHAPERREGIRRASQTKIYNLETGEFVSNPPFLKTNLAGVISRPSFRGNDGFKKNQKPGISKIVLNSGPQARKLVSNNLVPEPNFETLPSGKCHDQQATTQLPTHKQR
jgi:hypothetical protein